MSSKKLIIVGDSAFAQIAYEYFTHDSDFDVVAFSVNKEYLKQNDLFGIPIVPFEDLPSLFDPMEHFIFVAITYIGLNRVRTKLLKSAKEAGYSIATYISSHSFVWRNVEVGENCFIFENNVIQPFVKIGNNVILWSGNHIGHHSRIHDNVFIASHVVISGFVEVGAYSFIGVNSTISNNVNIGKDCLIGAGALITRDTHKGQMFKGSYSTPSPKTSYSFYGLSEVVNDLG